MWNCKFLVVPVFSQVTDLETRNNINFDLKLEKLIVVCMLRLIIAYEFFVSFVSIAG